jgi:hypothetical protein
MRDFRALDLGRLAAAAGRARVRDELTPSREGRLAGDRRVDAAPAARRAAGETFGALQERSRLR